MGLYRAEQVWPHAVACTVPLPFLRPLRLRLGGEFKGCAMSFVFQNDDLINYYFEVVAPQKP